MGRRLVNNVILMMVRLVLLHISGRVAAYCLVVQAILLAILRLKYRDALHVVVIAEMGVTAERLFVLDARFVHASAQAPRTRSC